jgi:hypothetical protein
MSKQFQRRKRKGFSFPPEKNYLMENKNGVRERRAVPTKCKHKRIDECVYKTIQSRIVRLFL